MAMVDTATALPSAAPAAEPEIADRFDPCFLGPTTISAYLDHLNSGQLLPIHASPYSPGAREHGWSAAVPFGIV